LPTGLASMRTLSLHFQMRGLVTLKSSTLLNCTHHFFSFQNIWSTFRVPENWWTLLHWATSCETFQLSKMVRTVCVISWHLVIYQELDWRFCIIIPVQWLTKWYSCETREILSRFHPLVQIFYTVAIRIISSQTEFVTLFI
jgi:hypothetical protein